MAYIKMNPWEAFITLEQLHAVPRGRAITKTPSSPSSKPISTCLDFVRAAFVQ